MSAEEDGFSLIEVLLALVISSMILAVVATAFVVSFRSSDESNDRLAASQDGSFTSAYFSRDAQSADAVSTTAAGCGSAAGTLVVALRWTDQAPQSVDYRYADGQLVRRRCGSEVRTDIVARSLTALPVLTCRPSCSSPRFLDLRVDSLGATFTVTGSRRSS